MAGIHPTAIVDDGASIASDATVGPYAIIGPDVTIGSGTLIDAHVVARGPTEIGRDNRFYPFSSIGDDPQDKKYANEPTKLVIGDRNTFREYCTVNRGTVQDQGVTRIGSDNWIMSYVHIAHDCVVGDHCILANNATLAGHVKVGDWAIMGGYAGIHQFCQIGAHAFLGMFAAIGKDVPAYVMVMGSPAAARGINAEGLKRRDFTPEQVRNIKAAYKVVYREGLRLEEALEKLRRLAPGQPEIVPMLESIERSERSIVR
ncbi:MAG: acyl-ACP--UDP-N-acetylglucosamine O-acyltransferase [Pseudomonadota bacterium]